MEDGISGPFEELFNVSDLEEAAGGRESVTRCFILSCTHGALSGDGSGSHESETRRTVCKNV